MSEDIGTETGIMLDAADQRALVKAKPPLQSAELVELMEYGEVVARSKFFKDMETTAQAVVKLSIGRELGLTKTASLTGVHVFTTSEGTRVIIGGQLLLAKINDHPDYRLEIVRSDTQACWLQPWQRGGLSRKGDEFVRMTPRCLEQYCQGGKIVRAQDKKEVGDCPACLGTGQAPVKFSIEDAKRLGLLEKKNWKGDPESMLLWRCVAKAQRRYFPGVLAIGQAYLADEFDEIQIGAAVAVAGSSAPPANVTVMRPKRASEAPPEATEAEIVSPVAKEHVPGCVVGAGHEGPCIIEAVPATPEILGPESFGGDEYAAPEPVDDADFVPHEPEKIKGPVKVCRMHGKFSAAQLFCPTCLSSDVKG